MSKYKTELGSLYPHKESEPKLSETNFWMRKTKLSIGMKKALYILKYSNKAKITKESKMGEG